MALEVVGLTGLANDANRQPYRVINSNTMRVGWNATVTGTTGLTDGDIILLIYTGEPGSGVAQAPAANNTHPSSLSTAPTITLAAGGVTSTGWVDCGYARGGNGNRQVGGVWAIKFDSSTHLATNGQVTYVRTGTSYDTHIRLLVVRGAQDDYSNASGLGPILSRSTSNAVPDQQDLEWTRPTGNGWNSTSFSGNFGSVHFGGARRSAGAVDLTAGATDVTNLFTTTTFTGTSDGTGQGGFSLGGGRQHHTTYFDMGRTSFSAFDGNNGANWTYGFPMQGGRDTNGGVTLSLFFREASTSTPGTPASLTADYAISVTGSPSTLGSEYAVTSTGTEADLQSSYTVKLTGDPQTLSSSYAVTDPDQTSTLGSEYAVKDTSGTANLSGLYAVQSTGTPATLSSEYQVAVPDSEDLSSDYAVKVQGDAQSLTSSYSVKVQGSPPSLSSSYDIVSAEPGTPATLGSEYSVKSTGNPQEVEADYSVTSTATVANLGGSYGVTSTGDPQTLSSGYAVTAPPNGVSLGAEYTVSVTGDEQEVSSAYAVTSSDEQTLTGSYVISDPDAISLSASYAVQSQGQDQDLTGTYGVTSASEDLPSLSSAYAVTSTGTAQTLDGSYLVSVAGQEADLLSDYAVTSSGTEPELTAGYAVTSIVDVDNSYAIKTSDTLEVSSSYAVTISDTENLSASYALIESKTQEIQASYEITGFTASAPVTELYAEYAVINQDHLGYKAFRQLSILRQRVK